MEEKLRAGYMRTRNELDEYLELLIKENKLPLQENRSQVNQVLESKNHVSRMSRIAWHMKSFIPWHNTGADIVNILNPHIQHRSLCFTL